MIHAKATTARFLAVFLMVALVYTPLYPVLTYADDVGTTTPASTEVETRDRTGGETTPSTETGGTGDTGTGTATTTPETGDTVDTGTGTTTETVLETDTGTTTDTGADTATSDAATTTDTIETDTGTTTATSTPIDTGTGTTTESGISGVDGPDAVDAPTRSAVTDDGDPSGMSDSTTISGLVDPGQSDTDNTDFQDITRGAPLPGENDPRPVIDASATSTEALATAPQFAVATSTNGTGSKIGGTIFTGSATASTTVKNILNITKSNVDGPGTTNGSLITGDTENVGTVTTSDETRALTGDNDGFGGEGDATIHTGKAIATAQVLNVVNTNLFNSKGLVLFLNPFDGDGLDLRNIDLSYFSGGVGASPTQLGCTILTCLNSSALSVLNKNTATVDSDVYVRAATGDNAATSTMQGGVDIQTGDAYAAADVLNMVNSNFINSKYLVLSFNNFGDLNDDIVLPEASFFANLLADGASLPELNSSSYVVDNTNDENFYGTTTAHAITGGNVASSTAEGHGEIFTGRAFTSSNSYTAANQTRVGGSSVLMTFRVAGNWSGTVKGLPAGLSWRHTDSGIEIYSVGSAGSQGSLGEYNSSAFVASSTNIATVNTDIDVWAETGNNSALTENATSTISTGNAYATANVVNLVNTNIVNRNWVFASFNIAGDWSGDITFGGHSPNLKVTTTVEAPATITPGSDVVYHFTVENHGDVDANEVSLTAAYDKNLLFFSRSNGVSTEITGGTRWDLGSLAAGRSSEIIATARVSAPGLPAGFSMTLPLTATVSASGHDQDDSDNSLRTTISVSAPASTGGSGGASGGGGGGTPAPSGGGGGGGSPAPSGGGGGGGGSTDTDTRNGGSTSGGGGGGTPAPSGGGGGGGSPAPSGGGGGGAPAPSPSGGAAGGVLGASTSGGGGATGSYYVPDPLISIKKTHVVNSGVAPAKVDYKVIVFNEKYAGPAYKTVLTDTLYSPTGKVMSNRSWDLDVVAPGDEITLTYTVAFATTTAPGTYYNVARVTGGRSPTPGGSYPPMNPVEVRDTVTFASNGNVFGTVAATSTVEVSTTTLKVVSTGSSCAPLLTTPLRMGSTNKTDVMKLQSFLNTQGAKLPVTGVFGPMTRSAVMDFQKKYASEILTPVGLSAPTGTVGPSTMKKINKMVCGGIDPVSPASSSTTPQTTQAAASAPAAAKAKAPAKATTKTVTGESNKGLLNAIGGWFKKSP